MISNPIITLLTDFGDRDSYVGVMKGAIANINPQIKTIDLTHQVPSQNLLAARFAWANAYPYFPSQTIHLGVVDPGVGSKRRNIAIKLNNGYLVCPDNGICSGILELEQILTVVELTNSQYWRVLEPSNTFHGRDIFAPVAAHIANGVSLPELGKIIEPNSLTRLNLPTIQQSGEQVTGYIQYIDHFGNLITNIPGKLVQQKSWQVMINNITIDSGKTYSQVNLGKNITMVGSHGWIEIAVNSGSAQQQLQLTERDPIQIKINYKN